MTQQGSLTPASLAALRSRFEEQSRKAQAYYTVMHAARASLGNDDAASAWMGEPLAALGGKTPAELVGAGRAQEVLDSIRNAQPGMPT